MEKLKKQVNVLNSTLTLEETDFTQKIKGLQNGKFLLFSKSHRSCQCFDTRELEKTANFMPLKLLWS